MDQTIESGLPPSENKGVIIAGEAPESDSESEEGLCQEFFAERGVTEKLVEEVHDSPEYDSLLHKKLKESNLSLYKNTLSMMQDKLKATVRAVNSTNQQLLVAQIHIQDSAAALSKAFDDLNNISKKLNSIKATDYFLNIKNM